jgi:hypothetical protein
MKDEGWRMEGEVGRQRTKVGEGRMEGGQKRWGREDGGWGRWRRETRRWGERRTEDGVW